VFMLLCEKKILSRTDDRDLVHPFQIYDLLIIK
jgi:hypothetical protein